MIRQKDIAILAPIKPDLLERLRGILTALAESLDRGESILFDQLIENHFSRWVILEESQGRNGTIYPPQLLFSSNIDGDQEVYLAGLIALDPKLIDSIYSCCEGFPGVGDGSNAETQVLAYWKHYSIPSSAYYVGAFGHSREKIKREEQLSKAIREEIDRRIVDGTFDDQSPTRIRRHLQTFVRSRSDLNWALIPESSIRRADLLHYILKGVFILGVVLIAVFAFLIPASLFFLVWMLVLRWHEEQDREEVVEDKQAHYEHIARVAEEEDHVQQNPMTSVTEIKPGLFRQLTLKSVMFAINYLAEYLFVRGKLGRIGSIHFARWAIIDEGRRLLFLSNYDGSWESYLGDFVNRASTGLTAVWSNTIGFPKTRWLIRGGARYVEKFKSYARASQMPTQLWYTPYRRLSVTNILDNADIREGLNGSMDACRAEQWLKKM